jgi:cytochrome c-type biogenesis protein CcmF
VASGFSSNLVELGHFAAYLAMVFALLQALGPLLARWLRVPALAGISVSAATAVFLLTTIGGVTLIYSFVISNFSVLYVAEHSNRALPLFYKLTALWGGHEGSLYLWVWILTFYSVIVGRFGRHRYPQHVPLILAVEGWLAVGFFGLILFLSSPFERLLPPATDGNDLNPLLQDPGMAFHPPMLYLGYVGFSVPFAFAMTALLTNWNSTLWSGLIRRWALIAWGLLTTGIILGGWWSYRELGWGGYWAWDPVENASFMPWLLGTALIHSLTVQDHRRMLHAWNIFLVITTFSLSLVGTFLVRSGVLSSVHAFAVDPGRGAYILAFMTTVLTVSFSIFMNKGRYQQAQESISSLVSRESVFVWNNVVFTFACATVMLATLYPLAVEALSGAKITVGPPYFNAVMVPVFLVVLLLMGIGPMLPWRKANLARLRSRLLLPVVLGLVSALATIIFCWPTPWVAPVGVGLVGFVVGTISEDLMRAVKQRRAQLNESIVRATLKAVLGNRRHYGGMIVHLGILVIALGLVGSGLFRSEVTVAMAPGDIMQVGNQRLRFDGVRTYNKDNYQALQARLTLLDSGRVVTPERRTYTRQEAPMTETGIDSTPLRDVYVVIRDHTGDKWVFHAFVNPLIQFLWLGGAVVLGGLGLALSSRASRVRKELAIASGLAEVK